MNKYDMNLIENGIKQKQNCNFAANIWITNSPCNLF